MSDIIATIQLRADTSAQWTLHNPTLKSNEIGIETNTFTSSGGVKLYKIKLGDGATAWNSLAYGNIGQFFAGGGSGSASWGDITGTISNQTDLQAALSEKANAPDLSTETTARIAGDASTLSSANTYTDSAVNSAVVGLLDDRGNYDASVNTFPASGGSGTAGAILKGDLWTVSVAGTLGGVPVTVGDVVRAKQDTPGQTAGNWAVTENNIGYVPENNANKTGTIVGNESSTTLFGTIKGWYDYLVSMVWLTAQIFGTWSFGLSAKTTPVDADTINLVDTADTNKSKKVTWANIKATLKTYFDTIYTRSNLGIQSGQVIVTSGTSFTTPANITTSTAWEIIGVGGGGGGGSSTTAGASSGGGGGGGVFILHITGLSPSTTYTCAIGQGGAGGTGPGNGNAGTATTLTIGATTYTANGGGLGPGGASATGGAGGTATGGTINFTGQNGADSPTASVASTGGQGGDSALCYGSGGASVKTGVAGNNGSGYGAGGGASKANATGGNGTNGIIIAKYIN